MLTFTGRFQSQAACKSRGSLLSAVNSKTTYVLIVVNQNISIYRYQKAPAKWESHLIHGELWSLLDDSSKLELVINQLNEDINASSQLQDFEIVVVYEPGLAHFLKNLSTCLTQLQCQKWQVLDWRSLWKKAHAIKIMDQDNDSLPTEEWLKKTFLPVLASMVDYQDVAWEMEYERAKQEHDETVESLRQERLQLEIQLREVKQQMASIQNPDLEYLLTYLPIIYRNFWGTVKPSDLALLAGTYQIPNIPSPFPEPDANTIAIMKTRFQQMPQAQQERLIYFCHQLQFRLDIRPEMKFILESKVS